MGRRSTQRQVGERDCGVTDPVPCEADQGVAGGGLQLPDVPVGEGAQERAEC